jgi:hypothetical protein
MTVQSTAVQSTQVANGIVTTFTYQYKLQEASDLVVQLLDTAVPPVLHGPLVLNSDYTVDPLGLNLDAGGNINNVTYLGVNIPNGWTVVMTREMGLTQDTDLANQGTYLPENVEGELDAVVMMIQGHDFQLQRCVRAALTDVPMLPLPPALSRLGLYLAFDPVAGQPNLVPGAPTVLKDNFAANTFPTAANDNTQGYTEGSRWFDTTHNVVYLCMSAATGAAVWAQIVVKNNLAAGGPPTVANDNTQGYTVNSIWVYGSSTWMCVSAATGAAIWVQMLNTSVIARNFFADPSCRIKLQAAVSAAPLLTTSYKYGVVTMFQAKGAGTAVNAGTIIQGTNGDFHLNGTSNGTSLQLAGVTITGAGQVFARAWLEAADAKKLAGTGGTGQITISLNVVQNTLVPINYTIAVNSANAANNFGAVTNVATSGNIAVQNAVVTPIQFTLNLNAACANGIEIVIQAACGAVTTKNFDFTDWQILSGPAAPFVLPLVTAYEDDMIRVLRYFEQSYEDGTLPGTVVNNGMTSTVNANLIAASGNIEELAVRFRVEKVLAPTMTIYSTNTGASGNIYNQTGAADTAVTYTSYTQSFFPVSTPGLSANKLLRMQWTADARL